MALRVGRAEGVLFFIERTAIVGAPFPGPGTIESGQERIVLARQLILVTVLRNVRG